MIPCRTLATSVSIVESSAPFLEAVGVQFSCRRGNIIRKIGVTCETITNEKASVLLATASFGLLFFPALAFTVHVHSSVTQRHLKARSSVSRCSRSMITKKGKLVVGCKSGRMAVSYGTCSNLVTKHAAPRSPSIVPHITHRPRFLYYRCSG